MGAAFVNHWGTSAIGWAIAVFILAVNACDVYEFAHNEISGNSWMLVLFLLAVALYLAFVLYLAIGPKRWESHIRLFVFGALRFDASVLHFHIQLFVSEALLCDASALHVRPVGCTLRWDSQFQLFVFGALLSDAGAIHPCQACMLQLQLVPHLRCKHVPSLISCP